MTNDIEPPHVAVEIGDIENYLFCANADIAAIKLQHRHRQSETNIHAHWRTVMWGVLSLQNSTFLECTIQNKDRGYLH